MGERNPFYNEEMANWKAKTESDESIKKWSEGRSNKEIELRKQSEVAAALEKRAYPEGEENVSDEGRTPETLGPEADLVDQRVALRTKMAMDIPSENPAGDEMFEENYDDIKEAFRLRMLKRSKEEKKDKDAT